MKSDGILGRIKMVFMRGLLVVLPLFIAIFVIMQLYNSMYDLISPIASRISDDRIFGVGFPGLIVILFLTLIIFIAGLIFSRPNEDSKLSKMIEVLFPRYFLIRGMFSTKLMSDSRNMKPCLVFSDDSWVFAFIIEETDDGMVVVYIPSSPSVSSGMTCIKYKDQVRQIDSTIEEIARALIHFGKGGSSIVSNKADWTLPGS